MRTQTFLSIELRVRKVMEIMDCFPEESPLDRVIKSAPSFYVLMKRVGCPSELVEYLCCNFKKREFVQPKLESGNLSKALWKIMDFEQRKCCKQTLRWSRSNFPEALKRPLIDVPLVFLVKISSGLRN